MKQLDQWQQLAMNILKSELKRKGFNYKKLSEALKQIGVEKTSKNIALMINRGSFSFAFFLQCAEAIGLDKLHLEDLTT